MQYQWVGKKTDLALLRERIEDFFKNRKFRVEQEKLPDGFSFSLVPLDAPKSSGAFVKVTGKPDDFVVEFEISEGSRTYRVLGSLAALIGGGGLLLRGFKSEDKLKELEKDFWTYVGEWLALTP